MSSSSDWHKAIEQTYVVKYPKQHLATFGITSIEYFVVTEPLYTAMDSQKKELEGVVRKGKVKAEQPTLITPTYAMNLKGFSDEAYKYFSQVAHLYGANSPGIMYQYNNEPENLEILSGNPNEIAHRISKELRDKKNDLSVVISGVDEFWDVALLKFIYEFTASSASFNSREMRGAGLMEPQNFAGGVPAAAANQIEEMFKSVKKGGSPETLKNELDKWGVYQYYEDRFLNLFR
jgi:hypothetical protein